MAVVWPGLDEAEVGRRLAEFGPNTLEHVHTRNLWRIITGTLREPMFLLLIAASTLYLFVGDLAEGLFLTAAAVATVALVVVQEARSERALKALRELAAPTARVIRGGQERVIPVAGLAPGDIILVGEGQRVPADGMLVDGEVLSIDESMLTGESAPVSKAVAPSAGLIAGLIAGVSPAPDAQLFAGTLVVAGHCTAQVTATGANTALGKIGASLSGIDSGPTPLQKSTDRMVFWLGLLALIFAAVVVVAYGLLRGDWMEGALAGITIAISLIPEEFPIVLAVFMALGSWRLARHRVLVRRGAAIETLGGATLLCVDKTGTLTENRMTVAKLWSPTGEGVPSDADLPASARAVLTTAVLASAIRATDPMDRALRSLGPAGQVTAPQTVWPLKASRLAVVQRWLTASGGPIAATKGSPEAVFSLCRMTPSEIEPVRRTLDQMAGEGLRVLGVAAVEGADAEFEQPEEVRFAFHGLIGFLDPVRPDVPGALLEARRAGIAVAMITGDYPATAMAIARQAGMDVAAGVLTGEEIAGMEAETLNDRLRRVRVFARIRPEQKLALVEAFKADGEIVAMTGDGVNDAPALEAAHIGVAMGQRGTDVAREAADLVLLDDSFASIVSAVRLGRRIFANLKRALTYITAIHVPIAGMALLPILAGAPPMLFPLHVVFLQLVINPVCSIVFEAEPSEEEAMTKPPRPANGSLFGLPEIAFGLFQGAVILGAVLAFYIWALAELAEPQARAAAFVALALANLALALVNSMSAGTGLFEPHRRAFWAIGGTAVAVLTLAVFMPVVATLFRFEPAPLRILGVSVLLALLAGGWAAPMRWLFRLRIRRPVALRPRLAVGQDRESNVADIQC